MKIPSDVVEQVRQIVSVEEVISDFVTLKRKGHYLSACCPFHHEKTPSFTVTPAKGIYKCFGCGKAGDAIQFVMDIEGATYMEAIKYLADKYGIEIKEEEQDTRSLEIQNEKESLLIALNFAKNFFNESLLTHEEGQSIGYSYFLERGFSDATIKKFELGYSLNNWDAFTNEALSKLYNPFFLEKAGLIIKKEGEAVRYYDRFRGRVIFPIHNLAGKVVGFGARILKNEKNQPKYLNSPESEVYHKSKILYGLFQARQAIRAQDNCYLVEGYTDVISLHQGGIENVVSSSGTSLTVDQIKLIKRFSENITMLYDGDTAGIKASLRGIDLILEEGLNVKVVTFPEGEDPDSYIKKIGGTAFNAYVAANAKDFITYKTELALREVNGDPIKKAQVIKEIVESISKIPDSIKRSVFFRQCSKMLDIDESTLITEFNKKHLQERKKQAEDDFLPPLEPFDLPLEYDNQRLPENDKAYLYEKEVIRLLISYGNEEVGDGSLYNYLLQEIEDVEFTTPVLSNILSEIKAHLITGVFPGESYFLHHEDESIRKQVIDLVTSQHHLSPGWELQEIIVPDEKELLSTISHKLILRLKKKEIERLIKENQKNMLEPLSDEELMNCQQIHMQLKKLLKEVADELGTIVG